MLEDQTLNLTKDEFPGNKSRKNMPVHVYASQFLRMASRRIMNQRNAVIEEQRFHALFQMLAIILHELNQPLTSLMGNIELMKFYEGRPDKVKENLQRINDAGKRMSGIIKKLQEIRNGTHLPPVDPFHRSATEKKFTVLALVNSDDNFSRIKPILNRHVTVDIHRIYEEEDALSAIKNQTAQLIIMDDDFLVLPGMRFLTHIKKHFSDIPIVFIVGKNREIPGFKGHWRRGRSVFI